MFFALSSAAASLAQGVALTLDDALTIALSENPAVEALRHEEMAARRERQAVIGLRMPKIGVTGAYAYLGKDIALDLNNMKEGVNNSVTGLITNGVQGGIIPPQMVPTLQGLLSPMMGADWQLMLQNRSLGFVGGEVTMPIWLGGKINTASRAARINQNTVEASGRQTRNALVSELVERYYGLALAKQVVEVRRQVVAGVGKHLEDAKALMDNGMLARSEYLYVEFKMAEAERELANAELQVSTISDALNNTLGKSEGEYLPVTEMFVVDNIEAAEYYRDMAADRNPLLNQVGLKRDLAHENVRLQRSEFFPQVVAMGGASFYTYQVTDILPRWAVGVGVSFKIFDGLNREYKYSAAKQTLRRVDALKSKAENDIAVLVEKLYNQMLNYRNQLHSIDSSINFAEEYLKAKDSGFLEGMTSSSELIDAELNLAKARTERMQAAYNFDVALAQLLEAAGISDQFAGYARRADARRISFTD